MLKESIKHFESLQKRYTTQHNGKQCEYVKMALAAMRKQVSAKVVNRNGDYGECYICGHSFCGQLEYCPICKGKENNDIDGQLLYVSSKGAKNNEENTYFI